MASRGGGGRGRGVKAAAAPSRHLWIGNLSHGVNEDELTRHFLEFGDLESVAFLPGRSFAFVNFKAEEDARAAMEALNGLLIAGNALRVEFTKADKSSAPSREVDYSQRRGEQNIAVRGSPLSQREFRARQDTPEQNYQEKSGMGDKDTEPSEVLWIGFPALLKVDEFILRKSFAPFGEIEKITAFPGRSYAFVRFRSVMSASRAKAALQGKLFGNPRVHICFARSDNSSSNTGRNSSHDPPSRHVKFNGRAGSSENSRQDRNFGSFTEDYSIRSPQYFPASDSGGYEPYSLKRKGNWTDEDNAFEHRRPGEIGPHGIYGHQGSPTREKYAHLNDYSQRFPRRNPPYEEPWELPDDVRPFHGAKKLNIPEKDLPDYPVSVYDQERQGFPRFKKPLELWKWEGTIAKGGTPVCRARCFPVGKVLDMVLPEFLDCTARTGLDMLSKHYDQATSAWVVFFAPGSDADIGHYNEFMQYLGEKERAAVAKLDDKTTLFLVPPSEFSEKVLKVPGKLSISGVVLRIDQPDSNFGSYPQQHERNPYSVSLPQFTSLHDSSNSGVRNLSSFPGPAHGVGNGYESYNENRHEYPPYQENSRLGPNWSSYTQSSVSATSIRPNQASNNAFDPGLHEQPPVIQRPQQQGIPTGGMSHVQNDNFQDTQPTASLPMIAALQPEQLANLASLLKQQKQSGTIQNPPTGEDFRHRNAVHETENQPRTYQNFAQQNNQANFVASTSQFSQPQQLQQQPQQQVSYAPHMVQRDTQTGGQGNQHLQNTNTNEGGETDRMQATLQLAAALLQQIQQGKGS